MYYYRYSYTSLKGKPDQLHADSSLVRDAVRSTGDRIAIVALDISNFVIDFWLQYLLCERQAMESQGHVQYQAVVKAMAKRIRGASCQENR